MKIFREYSIVNIKKNKRMSFGIAAMIFIAATFICTLSIFAQSYWQWLINEQIYEKGNWHAETVNISNETVRNIKTNENIAELYLKGSNQTFSLKGSTGRNYLFVQNCDDKYWVNMPEQYQLLEGRLPKRAGEIVVEKNFFTENAKFQIGDEIVLPSGTREMEGTEKKFLAAYQDGEEFVPLESKTLIIVGCIDVTFQSGYNGYAAYGFLSEEMQENAYDMVIYLKYKNPAKVFQYTEEIGAENSFMKDEKGKYIVYYNDNLLRYYAVLDKRLYGKDILSLIIMFLILIVIVSCIFIFIIKNAFTITEKHRNRQLGILKSIGATPKQIRRCVIYEGCILSIIPIVMANLAGYFFTSSVLQKYSSMLNEMFHLPIKVVYLPTGVLFATAVSFLTVFISLSLSSGKVSKLQPIQLLMPVDQMVKKRKKLGIQGAILKKFGFEGELAGNFFSANKKAFQTCTSMLTLCFVLLCYFLFTYAVSDISNQKAEDAVKYNVNAKLYFAEQPNEELIDAIVGLDGIKDYVLFSNTSMSTKVAEDSLAMEFIQSGDLENFQNTDTVLKEKDGYRLTCTLVGLDCGSFSDYCEKAGINDKEYYEGEGKKAIIVNRVEKNPYVPNQKTEEYIKYVNIPENKPFLLQEKLNETINSSYSVEIIPNTITEKFPDIDWEPELYKIPIVIPIETYYNIVGELMPERHIYHYETNIKLLAAEGTDATVENKINQICKKYMGSSDFFVSSKSTKAIQRNMLEQSTLLIIYSLTAFIALIGISSGIFAILNSLQAREKDFAILKSVGLDSRGIKRTLRIEAMFFSVKPIICSIPFIVLIVSYTLSMFHVSWLEFAGNFPVFIISLYLVVYIVCLNFVYLIGNLSLANGKIIEIIKNN